MPSETVSYRPIADWPGYRVGDDGSVWRWLPGQSRGNGEGARWRRLKPGGGGEKRDSARVSLCREGKTRSVSLAHLVLKAFVGPRPQGFETYRFPDRDPMNCRLDNLRWAPKGTHLVGTKLGKLPACTPPPLLAEQDVREILALVERPDVTQLEVAELYGVCVSTINSIVHGRRWGHLTGRGTGRNYQTRGAEIAWSKLTHPQVRAIPKLARLGHSTKEIAARFDVTRQSINALIAGITWSHVTGIPKRRRPRPRKDTARDLSGVPKN